MNLADAGDNLEEPYLLRLKRAFCLYDQMDQYAKQNQCSVLE